VVCNRRIEAPATKSDICPSRTCFCLQSKGAHYAGHVACNNTSLLMGHLSCLWLDCSGTTWYEFLLAWC